MPIAATAKHFAFLSALVADKRLRNLDDAQFRILCFLAAAKRATTKEIFAAVGLHTSSATRRLKDLEDKRLITRKLGRDDNRNIIVELTAAGLKVHAMIAELYRKPPLLVLRKPQRGRPPGSKNKPKVAVEVPAVEAQPAPETLL